MIRARVAQQARSHSYERVVRVRFPVGDEKTACFVIEFAQLSDCADANRSVTGSEVVDWFQFGTHKCGALMAQWCRRAL